MGGSRFLWMTFCLSRCFPSLVSTLRALTILCRAGRELLIYYFVSVSWGCCCWNMLHKFCWYLRLRNCSDWCNLAQVLRSFLAFNPLDFIRTSFLVCSAKKFWSLLFSSASNSESLLSSSLFFGVNTEEGEELLQAPYQH